jgi:hypothetical protein
MSSRATTGYGLENSGFLPRTEKAGKLSARQ